MDEERSICIKKRMGELFEIECEGKEPIICLFGAEGESVGASLFGVGAQGGESRVVMKCFSETDLKQGIAKKHGVNPENIILKEEE